MQDNLKLFKIYRTYFCPFWKKYSQYFVSIENSASKLQMSNKGYL